MRSIARIGAAAAAVLFVAGVPARADAAGPAPSAAERADAHGRWSDARTLLLSRWARDKSPETAAALGHAELRLGLAREAAEHLSAALRGLAKTDPARGAAAADLASAKRSVLTLRVSVNVRGAHVFVDDREVGGAPLAGELFVDEGAHVVRASLAGYSSASTTVRGGMGAAVAVDLALVRAPVELREQASVPSLEPASAAPGPRKNVWIIAAGSALGGIGLATGTGFMIATATGHGDQTQTNAGAAVALTAGAAALGLTLTYALWPASTPATGSAAPRVVAAASPMPGGGALVVSGSLGR